jgi:hypothetical protein
VDGINQPFGNRAASAAQKSHVSRPRFFPHEVARSPKRVGRGLNGCSLPIDSAPSTLEPKFRLRVLLSNFDASRLGLSGHRKTPHFQSLCSMAVFR